MNQENGEHPKGVHYQIAYRVLASPNYGIISKNEDGETTDSGTISRKGVRHHLRRPSEYKTEPTSSGKDFVFSEEDFKNAVEYFVDEMDVLIKKYSLLGVKKKDIDSVTESVKKKVQEEEAKIEALSPHVFEVAPQVHEREGLVTDALSEETGIGNLAHYGYPIKGHLLAELEPSQEARIRNNGDGNIYGADRCIELTYFGVPDTFALKTKSFMPIEDLVSQIKDSSFYRLFVSEVSEKVADKNRIKTDPIFHDFEEKNKSLKDVEESVKEFLSPVNPMDKVFALIAQEGDAEASCETVSNTKKP